MGHGRLRSRAGGVQRQRRAWTRAGRSADSPSLDRSPPRSRLFGTANPSSLCHTRTTTHIKQTQLSSCLYFLPTLFFLSSLHLHLPPRPPTAMHSESDDAATVHGLTYPPSFLDVLPVLRHRQDPHPPIRALTAAHFSDLHLKHLTAHAPDHVLFPFLHGLEGDNEQQNAFFSSSRSKGDVPSFRGLIWVACDEDEEEMCDTEDLEDDDDDYSTSSSLDSFEPADLEDDVAMELDPTVEGPMVNGCPPPEPLKKVPLTPSPVPLTTSIHPPPPPLVHSPPAFLTSSFRVRELLRMRSGEAGAHVNAFVEPRIPDGISLRNFGIQVVSADFFSGSADTGTIGRIWQSDWAIG